MAWPCVYGGAGDPRQRRRRMDPGLLRHPRPGVPRAAVRAHRGTALASHLALRAAPRKAGGPTRAAANSSARRSGARARSAPPSRAPRPSGPVLFDGWDAQGEPVGKPWATPHIQITACSEEQTDNTWRALQPMIELGPLGQRTDLRHRPHPHQPAGRGPGRAGHAPARGPGSGSASRSRSRTRPSRGSARQPRPSARRQPAPRPRRHGRPVPGDLQRARPRGGVRCLKNDPSELRGVHQRRRRWRPAAFATRPSAAG